MVIQCSQKGKTMFTKLKELQLAILGLLITLGMISSALIISDNLSNDNITVTGSAYQIVQSDSASWSFTVNLKSTDKLSGHKELKNAQPKIFQYLKDKGIDTKQIDITPYNSYPTYRTLPNGHSSNDISHYNFNQTYKVTSNNVEKIKLLSTEISELIEKGIDISSHSPQYQYSGIGELKIKLLHQATQDAKERAQAMLGANNNRVDKMRSVRMGVFQITQPNSNSVSDYGIHDTSTIDKKVTAVVNVVFGIK